MGRLDDDRPIYELVAEEERNAGRKDTVVDFEEGLKALERGDHLGAVESFRQILGVDRADRPAAYLIRKAVDIFQHNQLTSVAVDIDRLDRAHVTGIPAVDHQHRRILMLADLIIERDGQLIPVDGKPTLLEELRNYLKYHFEVEERMTKKVGYDKIEGHSAEHKRILLAIASLNLGDSKENLRVQARQMREVYLGHIEEKDRDFSAYYLANI